MSGFQIGMDIGGTNIRIGAAQGNSELIGFRKLPRRDVLPGTEPCERLAAYLRTYIAEELQGGPVDAVVIGLPSTISPSHRRVLQSPNVEGLDGVDLADGLEKELGVKVWLERDANLLLYHDMKAMALPQEGFTVGIYVGTGIGNALFLNGKPYTGRNGVAGELGHLPMIGSEKICGCGNIGCTECYASGKALEYILRDHFPDTSMSDLFVKHGQDPILLDFVDGVACVVAAEINLLDPTCVVLGGGVLTMPAFPMKLLEEKIHLHARKPLPEETIELRYTDGLPENGVYGALICAQKL